MTESVATHTLRFAKQASNFRLSHRSSFSSFTFASTRPSVPSLDLPIPFSGWRRYLGGEKISLHLVFADVPLKLNLN